MTATLATVLHDVEATYPIPVTIEPPVFDDDTTCVWITTDGQSKAGVLVDKHLPANERLADAAAQVADWLIEALPAAGLPAVWPECALHPDSHPLDPHSTPTGAAWTCPKTGQALAPVGSLAPQ
jgi:hypothetical protein